MCAPLWTIPWVVVLWLVAAATAAGPGLALLRRLDAGERPLFDALWLGLGLVLGLLSAWHLLLPVDGRTVIFLGAFSVACWLAARPRRLAAPGARVGAIAFLLVLAAAVRALGPLAHFDTGLYHLQAVEWTRSFASVPGLGNLHGRLAFGSSFTLLAALFDAAGDVARGAIGSSLLPTDLEGWRLANGWIVTAALLHTSWAVLQVFRGTAAGRRLPLRFLAFGLCLPLGRLGGLLVPSLSTDLPAEILGYLAVYYLLEVLDAAGGSRRALLAVLLVVAGGGASVKLSLLPLVSAASVLGLWKVTRADGTRSLAVPSALALISTLPWLGRNVVLSGHLLYPVAATALPLPWALPRPLVLSEARWIEALARTRRPLHWLEVEESWRWLGDAWRALDGRFLFVAAWCLVALAAVYVRKTGRTRRPIPPLVVFLPPLAALGSWAATAPDPRFVHAPLVALAALLALRALPGRPAVVGLVAILAVGWTALPLLGDGGADMEPSCPVPTSEWQLRVTDDGTEVHVVPGPATVRNDFACWSAPLPCTPFFRPSLQRRGPSLGHGFVLSHDLTYADMRSTVAPGFDVAPALGLARVDGWRAPHLSGDGETVFGSDGRLLVYAEEATKAYLHFRVAALHVGGDAIDSGTLVVELDGELLARHRIEPGDEVGVGLIVGPGFGDLHLRFEPRIDASPEGLRFPAVAIEDAALVEAEPGPSGGAPLS